MPPYSDLSDSDLLDLLSTEEDRLPRAAVDEIVSRGRRMIKPLTRLVAGRKQWQGKGPLYWRPIHATYLLGAIGGEDAVTGLMHALILSDAFEDGGVIDDLPAIFAGVGGPAVRPLIDFLQSNPDMSDLGPIVTVQCLGAIAVRHPAERDAILDSLLDAADEGLLPGFVRLTAAETVLAFARPQDREILEGLPARGDLDEEEIPDGPLLMAPIIQEAYETRRPLPAIPDPLRFYSPEQKAVRDARRKAAKETQRWCDAVEAGLPWVDEEIAKIRSRYEATLADLTSAARTEALRVADSMNDYALHTYGGAPWDWDVGLLDDYLGELDEPAGADDVLRYLRFWHREGRLTAEELEATESSFRTATRPERMDTVDPEVMDSLLPAAPAPAIPGRNDPCSCGSGKKFKKCCG